MGVGVIRDNGEVDALARKCGGKEMREVHGSSIIDWFYR